MSRVGVDRLSTGLATTTGGGSNGNTITAPIVTASLSAGTTEVTHALGKQPLTVTAQDNTGTSILIDWQPKTGSETTIVEVTYPVAATDVKFTFQANA